MFSYTFCNILFHGFSLKQFCATDSEQINEANKKITVYKKTDEWDICRCNAVYTRLTFYKRSNFEYILKYCLQLPLEQWNDVFGQSFISTPYFPKKESLTKMANRCNSLSLVVTRCLSLFLLLPLVVSLIATRCHLLYHLLSVIWCQSLYYSLPRILNRYITRICLFVDDPVTRVC